MAHTPLVTFLLAVHNNAATIGAAIDSILAQTYAEVELVVVDDACIDGTPQILARYTDPHIRRFTNDRNLGLSRSLNRGWAAARGVYVARMDADDLCLPGRALRQVEYLEQNPSISVVGSFIETFTGDSGAGGIVRYPTDPAFVASTLLFRNALAHPAVMIRKSALDAHGLQFEPAFRCAQDYALWIRCVQHRLTLANIPEVLLNYRLHPGQLSHQFFAGMHDEGTVIRERLLRHIDPSVTAEELVIHDRLSRDELPANADFIASATNWLCKLAAINQRDGLFPREAFLQTLTGRYVALLKLAAAHGLPQAGPEGEEGATSPFAPYIRPDALRL